MGNEVNDIYDAVCEKGGFQKEEAIDENLDGDVKEKRGIKDLLGVFMETLSSIFAPFIPAIVACGLLQGLLYSVQSLGWLDSPQTPTPFSSPAPRRPFISCRSWWPSPQESGLNAIPIWRLPQRRF